RSQYSLSTHHSRNRHPEGPWRLNTAELHEAPGQGTASHPNDNHLPTRNKLRAERP
ncbi:Hypothetical predicted protein, partial [Pelobates cultripes]